MKFLVIAIIAGILSLYACIYVPSYIEAIPRAKTARAKSNMRNIAIELESINYDPKPFNIQGVEDLFSTTHRDKTILNDPWNGTVSAGDIIREGKYPETPPQSHEDHRRE